MQIILTGFRNIRNNDFLYDDLNFLNQTYFTLSITVELS